MSIIRELIRSYGKVYLTLGETAQIIGIPEKTLRNQMSSGHCEIPMTKEGGSRLVPADRLVEHLEKKAQAASPVNY